MQKIALMFLLAAAAFGDYTMVMENKAGDVQEQTVRYRDDKHMNFTSYDNGRFESAFYVIGEKAYSVSDNDGQMTYFDVDEMRQLLSALGNAAVSMSENSYEEKKEEMQFKVVKKKGTVRVAGIKGETWVVSYLEDGKKVTEEIVVTENKGVKEVYRSWGVLFNRIFQPEKPLDFEKFYEVEPGYVAIKSKDMEITSFNDDRLGDAELALPKGAKQQSMPDFSGLFSGGSDDGSSDDDTATDASEEDDDDSVDQAVDLFKSLF